MVVLLFAKRKAENELANDYFFAIKLGPVNGVVAIDRLSLVFVVIMAALFVGEAFTWRVGLGAALMVGGALLISLK